MIQPPLLLSLQILGRSKAPSWDLCDTLPIPATNTLGIWSAGLSYNIIPSQESLSFSLIIWSLVFQMAWEGLLHERLPRVGDFVDLGGQAAVPLNFCHVHSE